MQGRARKKCAGAIAQTGDRFGHLVAIPAALDGRGRGKPLDIARKVLEPIVADRDPEILSRDIFQLMGFVHDRVGACRDHLAIRVLPDGGVRAQQVVIDDHDVGGRRALAHPGDKAVVVPRAFGAEAGFRRGRNFAPERQIFRQVLELGAIAGLCTGDHSRMIAGRLHGPRRGRVVQPIQAGRHR